MTMDADFQSFGRIVQSDRKAIDHRGASVRLAAAERSQQSLLAVGNTRSYGDSCHNDVGSLIDMRGANRILAFDPETGVLEAEAGAQLCDIIAFAAPHGFFPAVVPGTQFVTLGGAIANDVHGKNHHRRGTFGNHVVSLRLLRSDGQVQRCTGKQNPRLFAATIGGLGLTGMILSASIRLMRVPGLNIEQTVLPFDNLDGYFEMARRADEHNEYAVAWLDQLSGGRGTGRGVLLAGNHCGGRAAGAKTPRQLLSVPFQPPVNVLSPLALRAFNTVYYAAKRRRTAPHRVPYQSFFFPLDGVGHWNRLYGPRGLYQHQSVVPEETARAALPALLAATRRFGQASFLTVLKRFGDIASPGLLSFPKPGFTLTLDFPNRGRKTEVLLRELDHITIEAGGRVNPYKDARMEADVFAASFPHWQALQALRDPLFMSDFWRRTAMRLDAFTEETRQAAE